MRHSLWRRETLICKALIPISLDVKGSSVTKTKLFSTGIIVMKVFSLITNRNSRKNKVALIKQCHQFCFLLTNSSMHFLS